MTQARRPRGAATLVLVLGLFIALALVAALAQRNLLVEQRIASQVRDAAQAEAMARLGHDRLLQALNGPSLDARCEAGASARTRLRERWLEIDAAGAMRARAKDFVFVCDRDAEGHLDCRCADAGAPALLRDESDARTVSVRLALRDLPVAGHLELLARGCSRASAHCPDDPEGVEALGDDAQATQRQRVLLLPALRRLPERALVATQGVTIGAAFEPPPSGDEGLAPARLFQRHFGLPPPAFRDQPALSELGDCGGRCARALAEQVEAGAQMVWVDGDLVLDEALDLGRPERPLLLLVQGRLEVRAPLRLHGLIYAGRGLHWRVAGELVGGLLVAGEASIDRDLPLRHDPELLRRLQRSAGSFVRAPAGLWSEP